MKVIGLIESDSTIPGIGQIVQTLKGRETGSYSVVVQQLDERFVLIADGDRRKFDRAKRKNIAHLHLCDYVSPEVQNSIIETGRVTNGKLRYAVSRFVNEVLNDEKKGDMFDG